MSRQAREWVKAQRSFYRNNFRRILSILMYSVLVNVGLLAGVLWIYDGRDVPAFYATNGVTAPIKLTPLSSPNESSKALLQPDPANTSVEKQLTL